jgi:hypothetical protein
MWWFRQRRLDAAWRKYQGISDEQAEHHPDSKRLPADKLEFTDRLNRLVAEISR